MTEGAGSTNGDFITFGQVHLDVTNRERSVAFWRDLVGLEIVDEDDQTVGLGAGGEVLIVLHPVATAPVRRGHSGLYHLAIHLPNESEFARVLARLIAHRHPIAPTDHVLSKAIYLNDPDGIGLEVTLETAERVRVHRFDDNGFDLIDSQGRRRSGREPLDVEDLLAKLPDGEISRPLPQGTNIGHIHLHVGDLHTALRFYRDTIGFIASGHSTRLGFADLHAGGRFPHRIAVNTWQGEGATRPPAGSAGLRHFTIRFDTDERLQAATRRLPEAEHHGQRYAAADPAGNRLLLTT